MAGTATYHETSANEKLLFWSPYGAGFSMYFRTYERPPSQYSVARLFWAGADWQTLAAQTYGLPAAQFISESRVRVRFAGDDLVSVTGLSVGPGGAVYIIEFDEPLREVGIRWLYG